MKQILLSMIKGWLLEEAATRIIKPLRNKVSDSSNKWDDEMVNELEKLIKDWLK